MRREIAVLERVYFLKNSESTYFCSRRRASESPQQGPVGPGDWGFLRRILAASHFGWTQSRLPRSRQGRQMRTGQSPREQRRVSGQVSVWTIYSPHRFSTSKHSQHDLIQYSVLSLLGDLFLEVRHDLVAPRHHRVYFTLVQVTLGFLQQLVAIERLQFLEHLAVALG
jgi:hypothetical protein